MNPILAVAWQVCTTFRHNKTRVRGVLQSKRHISVIETNDEHIVGSLIYILLTARLDRVVRPRLLVHVFLSD